MKRFYTCLLLLIITSSVFSNTPADSLVRFSELSFQSDFEKQVFVNYLHENELRLCLATDKNMTEEKAAALKNRYEDIIREVGKEKLMAKNFRQKFKDTHKIIFHQVPMRYYEGAEFSDILGNGNFNYLTASLLYSLVLKELNIPSYLLLALNKSNIIINPGAEQVVLETVNQKEETGYFNTADSKVLIMNMLDKKTQPGLDYQLSPLQGNATIRINELEILRKTQLPAMIYYYKALLQYNAGKEDEAYRLIRKACYLCPEESYINIMYTILTNKMQNCRFNRVEDVDLLGQLSRFETNNFDNIVNTFKTMLSGRMMGKNDFEFCTAAYNRLLPQIKDVLLTDEISYIYYMVSGYYNNTYLKNLAPVVEALKLKPFDKMALKMVEIGLHTKLDRVEDPKTVLDTLDLYDKDLAKTGAVNTVKDIRLLTYLDLAKHCFLRNQPNEGEKYLTQFESGFQLPIPDTDFKIRIENAYYEYARYYARFNNHIMAQKMVDRGLKYIPNSNMIQSGADMIVTKPNVIQRKMNKAEYEKYMKKKVIL